MSKSKTVYKPWGKEVWLELNDKYCYKRIYINAGTKTSYQYHEQKLETNFIIDGTAEVWLENDEGVVVKTKMIEGDFFTVHPKKKHRIIALTDIILQECSTPEVDDVVRLEDDTERPDGRIDSENTPPSIAAGAIYLYCKHRDKNITKKELSDICKISEVTINKCFKSLEPFIDYLLN